MGSYLNPGSKGFQESLNSEIYVNKTGSRWIWMACRMRLSECWQAKP